MRNAGIQQMNKMRHSLKNMPQGKNQMLQMSNQIKKLQKRVMQLQSEKAENLENTKILSFQVESLTEKVQQQEEQLHEADNQLNDVEGELEEASVLKGTLEDQKYELMRKSDEIKQLNIRISDLRQDVFYRNKNVFDHNLLKMELDHQKKEAEVLKGRIKELEESCASLRIEGEIGDEDPVQKENHFTKKIFKLETKLNDLKRVNQELRKGFKSNNHTGNLLSSMISAKSSQKDFYPKKRKAGKFSKLYERDMEERDETQLEKIRELKDKLSQVEMEKNIYMDKNSELIQEIEKIRSQEIKKEKVKNNSLIDDKEFKKRLNKYRMENHELKDKLHEMETKLRTWETEHRLNNKSQLNTNSGNTQDNAEAVEMRERLQKKQKEIDQIKSERDLLLKKIDQLKFELEEKQKEVKTLEYQIMGEEDSDMKVQNLIEKNSKLGQRIMELETQIKKMMEMQSINSSGYPDKELDQILNE